MAICGHFMRRQADREPRPPYDLLSRSGDLILPTILKFPSTYLVLILFPPFNAAQEASHGRCHFRRDL
jgi:hypothetical protein